MTQLEKSLDQDITDRMQAMASTDLANALRAESDRAQRAASALSQAVYFKKPPTIYTEDDIYGLPLEKVKALIEEHYPEACI